MATADASLTCATCGYDLREHSADAVCPECATPVAESMRVAAIPLRPAWGDSDPRWRTAMLLGLWGITLIPLPYLVVAIAQPTGRFGPYGFYDFLDEYWSGRLVELMWGHLTVPIGLALLFYRERRVRPDWIVPTRRWGARAAAVTYVTALLDLSFVLLLVGMGIKALLAPPLQPWVQDFAVGPWQWITEKCFYISQFAACLTVALASLVVGEAVIRAGAKWLGRGVQGFGVALAAFVALLIALSLLSVTRASEVLGWTPFFQPTVVADDLFSLSQGNNPLYNPLSSAFWFWVSVLEFAKWSLFLVPAVWLTVAQLRAWWSRRKA